MSDALPWIGVAALGALGSWARFRVSELVATRRPSDFPLGTFVVNVSGAFALGLLTGLSIAHDWLLAVGAGLLGGYTTFSTWMVEALRLGERGARRLMLINLLGPMVAGLAAAAVGLLIGEALA